MSAKSRRRPPSVSQKPQRQAIFEAVLFQIPFDGWTQKAFEQGLAQAGLTAGEANLLFPQGIYDVIHMFGEMADEAMESRICKERGFAKMKIREKIAFAVRARLESLLPYREAMRRLMGWYALPLHWHLGARRLYRTVDLMWRAAGDTSTDFNFYTKRGLLVGVLKTTILFWLDDESPGCRASWEFLDRRITEVLKVGQALNKWRAA